jgi:seryl-tRNA synthetase
MGNGYVDKPENLTLEQINTRDTVRLRNGYHLLDKVLVVKELIETKKDYERQEKAIDNLKAKMYDLQEDIERLMLENKSIIAYNLDLLSENEHLGNEVERLEKIESLCKKLFV